MSFNVKSKSVSSFKMFSTNCAGVINGKLESLKAAVRLSGSNIITVQETHCRQKGRIKFDSLQVFEAIRKAKGGGTMIAVHTAMNPKLVDVYEDEFELLVVEIKVKDKNIRVISGYGPQENLEERRECLSLLLLRQKSRKQNFLGNLF